MLKSLLCAFIFTKCSCRLMEKILSECQQRALTAIYFLVIFAGTSFKLENVGPTFKISIHVLAIRSNRRHETVLGPTI